jgi:hypothetical protein
MRMRAATSLTLTIALAFGSLLEATTATGSAAVPIGGLRAVHSVSTTATSAFNDGNWASPDPAYVYADSGGTLHVVTYEQQAGALSVSAYDPVSLARAGEPTTISLSGWPDWGGFYAGPDGYFYVLVGRPNHNEEDSRDVVAVRRYDAGWSLVGTAYVKGGATQGTIKGIYDPFDAADPHMTLVGDRLVVHMARTIYAVEGVHHQVNLTFEVNVDTMVATTFDELGDVSYSSHSFQQLVAMNGTNLVMVDQGDAFPREIQLGVMASYPDQRAVVDYDLFDFNGEEGDNFTGASLTSLVSGPQGVVVLGNSIPQPDAPGGPLGSADEQRNIFAIAVDPTTGAHTVNWLTDFAPDGDTGAMEPRSVQVGDDRYAVLFGVRHGRHYQLEYRLIDSAGEVLASASFPDVFYSTICDPALVGQTVYWVGDEPDAAGSAHAYLFGLDVTDPAAPVLTDTERTIRPRPGTIRIRHKPRLEGGFLVGDYANVVGGRWSPSPSAYHYRWYRNGHPIPGAHGTQRRITRHDKGKRLTVKVTVSKPGYTTTSVRTKAHRVR